MTSVCTCCGDTFESDLPQEIGEELCNSCYKAIYIDPMYDDEDSSPLKFDPTVYGMGICDVEFEDLTPNLEEE